MQPTIYNHHRLPAAAPSASQGPPQNAGPASVQAVQVSTQRLGEMFDMIKQEFETLGQDVNAYRGQRDEYESKFSHQIQELALIRQSLYDLESTQVKLRDQYEAEITRLRRELDSRPAISPGAAPTATTAPGPAPIAPDRGVGGVPSFMPTPPGAGPGLNGGPERERERGGERERERERDGDRERDSYRYEDKVAKKEAPSPQPSAPSPQAMLSDLDPENVSRELKKEGSDWFAVWSSQTKRVLDVGLVHTFVHESVVCCVKFSTDGKWLATGCNRSAQIYDTKTGARHCVLMDEAANKNGDLYIRSICFSPDSKYLATGAEDRQIRIWDISKKRIRHLLQGHAQEIYSLDFSRDGRYLVSGSGDKSARVWDIETGSCVFDLRVEDYIIQDGSPIDAGITSVALSPDGKILAAGSLDTMVRVWNVQTGQQLERLKGHKDSVYSVAFSPDGKTLVSGSLDRTLRLWDLSATKRAVDASPSGAGAVGAAKEVPPIEKGLGVCATTLNGHKDYVLSVAVSPDGNWVVSGSKDRSIQFWNAQTGQAQFMLQGHKNSVISIDLARSGGLLASGSGDQHARIWSYGPAQ